MKGIMKWHNRRGVIMRKWKKIEEGEKEREMEEIKAWRKRWKGMM